VTFSGRRAVVGFSCCVALVGAISLVVQAVSPAEAQSAKADGQARTVADRVYGDAQATRGQQIYQAQCLACHGAALEGAVGPPLAGEGFLATWSGRSLADLVDKIEKTMPPQQLGGISRAQAIDLAAFLLRTGKFPAGPTELTAGGLPQIAFPSVRAIPAPAGSASFAAASNLAQLMRGVTFPNANILFNVQVKDPGASKPSVPVPFDYVLWGSTVYYGWQAVDQAALALIETTPLFLLPGRRCENGRPVPIDRANWQQYTAALVDAGRAAYKASQSRNVDAVIKVAEQLNAACDNCHKVYRDGGKEGTSAGAARCQ
jgi:mono/diheme cytochrome c family protein